MPDSRKADLYSFWRWEYLRRNKLYQRHYDALLKFLWDRDVILIMNSSRPPTEWLWSRILNDFVAFPEALNKINVFAHRFHVFPFHYENGPEVEELLAMAKSDNYDLSRSALSVVPNYQTDFYTNEPVGNDFDDKICAAENSVMRAWKRIQGGYDRTKHRHLHDAICNLQMLHVANPKFHTTEKEMVARAIGLYLWDKVECDGEKMGDVIRDLEHRGYGRSRTAYSERKTHAAACIKEREVLPFGSKP